MIPFVGFLPDADEHTEGVITACDMMLPTVRGYKAAPTLSTVSDPLAAACKGSAYVIKVDNTTRTFAGTQTKLYELTSSAWTDVSRVGSYTGTVESVWRFLQFGNVTVTMNKTDATQYSITGSFADLAGAPKALVGDVVDGHVMLANYDDGTDTADGIYWSAYQDYSDWTPSITTGCGYLRLYDTPGEIRALKRLGSNAVVFKENSMYLGVNSYSSALWGFNLIADDVGAVSHEAVVTSGNALYFIGSNDFWVFDGAGRPQSIGNGVREWFFSNVRYEFLYKVRGAYDRETSCILWYYPGSGSGLDSCIVYNTKTGKWGSADRNIESCVEVLTGAQTYGSVEAAYATYADIPSITYGSPFWTESRFSTAVFDTGHTMRTLTGSASASSISTGAVGDDISLTLIQRVQPRLTNDPTSATMTNYYRMTDGSAYATDQTVTMSSARFDVLRAARWHKFKMDFMGDMEIAGINYKLTAQGND